MKKVIRIVITDIAVPMALIGYIKHFHMPLGRDNIFVPLLNTVKHEPSKTATLLISAMSILAIASMLYFGELLRSVVLS